MMIGITLNKMYNFYPMYNYWVWWDKAYFLGFMLALPLLKAYNGEKGSYPMGRYFFLSSILHIFWCSTHQRRSPRFMEAIGFMWDCSWSA